MQVRQAADDDDRRLFRAEVGKFFNYKTMTMVTRTSSRSLLGRFVIKWPQNLIVVSF